MLVGWVGKWQRHLVALSSKELIMMTMKKCSSLLPCKIQTIMKDYLLLVTCSVLMFKKNNSF